MAIYQQPSVVNQRQAEIDRSRTLAKLLAQNANNTAIPDRMVSGRVVQVSPLEAIFKGMQNGYSAYLDAKANKEQKQIDTDKAETLAYALKSGGNIGDLAASGALDSADIAKLLVQKEANKQEAELSNQKVMRGTPNTSYIPPGSKLVMNGKFFETLDGALIPNVYGVRPSNDPDLQAQIAQAKEGQKGVKVANEQGQEYYAPQHQVNPAFKDRTGYSDTLRSLMKVESNFNPNAVSPTGAKGVTQFLESTAKDPGYGVKPVNLGSIRDQVRGGADYLLGLMDHYIKQGLPEQQAYKMALQAYNQGVGNAGNQQAQDYANKVMQGTVMSQSPAEKAAATAQAEFPTKLALEQEKQRLAIEEDAKKKQVEQQAAMNDPMRQKALADADEVINRMRKHYEALNQGNGMMNTKHSALSNFRADLESSAIGQNLGNKFGSDNQLHRNAIASEESSMIPILMNASKMTGGMLNSEVELKKFLDSLRGKDYDSTMEQLDLLQKMYGGGQGSKPDQSKPGVDDLVKHYLGK